MIELTLSGHQRASWEAILEIAGIMPRGWTLVGGQLTFLHLVNRDYARPRPTADLDAVIDVRGNHPTAVQDFVAVLHEVGFHPAGVSPTGHQHRSVRDNAQIDILIPRGLHPQRSDGNRQGFGLVTTIETAGAQLAIDRSSSVSVSVNGQHGVVNAPDLIGAIYGKCSALLNRLDADKTRHLEDILMLSSVTARVDREMLATLTRNQLRLMQSGVQRALGSRLPLTLTSPDIARDVGVFARSVQYALETLITGGTTDAE